MPLSDTAESLSNPPAWVPNWDAVPFEVACSRCGHDLRGLSDSRCPSCGLVLDWAKVVPIRELTCRQCGYHLYGLQKTRCPECGEGFTWEQTLADYHRRKIPIFEYRWRKEPIRSFVRTWWWALRPTRFWRRLDIHVPPMVRPLIVVFIAHLLLFSLGLVLLGGLDRWLLKFAKAQRNPFWRPPTAGDLPLEILAAARDPQLWTTVVATACWAGLILAALLIFQQSMRLYRVRTAHILRIWSCSSLVPVLPIIFVGFVASYGLTLSDRGWLWVNAYALVAILALTMLASVTWGLRCGYRYYLRMPHAGAVAICAQVIAQLAFITIELGWGQIDPNYTGIVRPVLLRLLVWT